MAFQKIQATQLFDGQQFLDPSTVLILDDDGVIQALVSASDAGDDIRCLDGILSPGFINCHCHLELSHMKDQIDEQTGLVGFVSRVMTQRFSPEELILEAIDNAESAMLRNGIVAVGDICNTTNTLAQKKKGRLYYHNFIEVSGSNPAVASQRFSAALEVFRQFGSEYSIPVSSNSLVPHAPYSVSDPLWELLQTFPGNHLLTIHNQETPAENELFLAGTGEFLDLYRAIGFDPAQFKPSGTSSLASILPRFLKNQTVLLVHNLCTNAEDVQLVNNATADFYWCLCPNANWYISRKLPDTSLFASREDRIVLGTDSLASNYQLSILSEIQRLLIHEPQLPLQRLLRWATSNGARALELDALLGSFEPGKKPGVICLSENLSTVERIC